MKFRHHIRWSEAWRTHDGRPLARPPTAAAPIGHGASQRRFAERISRRMAEVLEPGETVEAAVIVTTAGFRRERNDEHVHQAVAAVPAAAALVSLGAIATHWPVLGAAAVKFTVPVLFGRLAGPTQVQFQDRREVLVVTDRSVWLVWDTVQMCRILAVAAHLPRSTPLLIDRGRVHIAGGFFRVPAVQRHLVRELEALRAEDLAKLHLPPGGHPDYEAFAVALANGNGHAVNRPAGELGAGVG